MDFRGTDTCHTLSVRWGVNAAFTSFRAKTLFSFVRYSAVPAHDRSRSSCNYVSDCNEICSHAADYFLVNMLMSCITPSMMVGVGGMTEVLSISQDILSFAENL